LVDVRKLFVDFAMAMIPHPPYSFAFENTLDIVCLRRIWTDRCHRLPPSAIGLAATGDRFRSIHDGGDHEVAN
jgi:hypothetical protein